MASHFTEFRAVCSDRSFDLHENNFSRYCRHVLDCVWNVMAQVQKPDFVFRTKRTSSYKSAGSSVRSTSGSRGVRIGGSNAGYTMFRGSVKGTGYPLHSPVSPSLPRRASPCAITFQPDPTSILSLFLMDRNIHAITHMFNHFSFCVPNFMLLARKPNYAEVARTT